MLTIDKVYCVIFPQFSPKKELTLLALIPAAKIMIFTKRHNKMPKKPPPEEKGKPASICALAGFSYDKTCLVLVY